MKVFIVEDETLAAKRLQKMLKDIDPLVHVQGVADSIKSATAWFEKNTDTDLAFFDIELADGQSFEIFSNVKVNCPVIFITAYDEFALRAFKVNSIDYLLKPIDENELKNAIEKFKQLKSTATPVSSIESLIADLQKQQTPDFKERFLVKQGQKLISVEIADVAFFYTEEKVTLIKTKTGERHIINYSLEEVEGFLDSKKYFRANRQFILNIKNIKEVHHWFNGKLKVATNPSAEVEIIISRERATDFKKWMGE